MTNNDNEITINDYKIIPIEKDEIINEISDSKDEQILIESIIDCVELTAADYIKNHKIAQLPQIGCVRINPISTAIKKEKDELKEYRKTVDKETYKNRVRFIVNDTKEKLAKDDAKKLLLKKIKSRNKKQYDKLYLQIGKAYAKMFIYSIYLIEEVPYDAEVQKAYDRLNGLL